MTEESEIRDVGIRIWVGMYGDYPVPERFKDVRISKSTGWPDLRCKGATDMLQWAADMDSQHGKDLQETAAST